MAEPHIMDGPRELRRFDVVNERGERVTLVERETPFQRYLQALDGAHAARLGGAVEQYLIRGMRGTFRPAGTPAPEAPL